MLVSRQTKTPRMFKHTKRSNSPMADAKRRYAVLAECFYSVRDATSLTEAFRCWMISSASRGVSPGVRRMIGELELVTGRPSGPLVDKSSSHDTLGSCLKIGASVLVERVPRLYNITLDKKLPGVLLFMCQRHCPSANGTLDPHNIPHWRFACQYPNALRALRVRVRFLRVTLWRIKFAPGEQFRWASICMDAASSAVRPQSAISIAGTQKPDAHSRTTV
jgi:hypothetical protein